MTTFRLHWKKFPYYGNNKDNERENIPEIYKHHTLQTFHNFFLLLFLWEMVSELPEHSGRNLLFLEKHGCYDFACTHCTPDSEFHITQWDFTNCMEILRLIFLNELQTRDWNFLTFGQFLFYCRLQYVDDICLCNLLFLLRKNTFASKDIIPLSILIWILEINQSYVLIKKLHDFMNHF